MHRFVNYLLICPNIHLVIHNKPAFTLPALQCYSKWATVCILDLLIEVVLDVPYFLFFRLARTQINRMVPASSTVSATHATFAVCFWRVDQPIVFRLSSIIDLTPNAILCHNHYIVRSKQEGEYAWCSIVYYLMSTINLTTPITYYISHMNLNIAGFTHLPSPVCKQQFCSFIAIRII